MIELSNEWKRIELGDGASIEIKALDLRSYHRVLAFMMPYTTDKGMTSEATKAIMLDLELPNILEAIVPAHTKDIKGITLEGKEMSVEDFVKHGKLLAQNITVLSELLSYSSLTDDEEKN